MEKRQNMALRSNRGLLWRCAGVELPCFIVSHSIMFEFYYFVICVCVCTINLKKNVLNLAIRSSVSYYIKRGEGNVGTKVNIIADRQSRQSNRKIQKF